jgi:dihydroflavonol-4-reductase
MHFPGHQFEPIVRGGPARWEAMTALVTGATGFIGGNVARALWKRGENVHALVRPGANDIAIRGTGVQQYAGDLLDMDSLHRAAEGCDSVFHCAAVYAFWSRNPEGIYAANVQGTRNVIETALKVGMRRAVFTSSVSTIGWPDALGKGNATHSLANEETPVNPKLLVGHYKRSKFQAEQEALSANEKGLPVIVVNPCAPVGKWDVKPTPTGRIPLDFARGRIPGYMDTGLNLVDVDDVAEGHILAMERGRPGQRYILGNRNLTLLQVFGMLADITGRRVPRLRFPYPLILGAAYVDQWIQGAIMGQTPRIPVEGIRVARHPMYVTSQKAVEELGMPQNSVEIALEKAVRWFADHGYIGARS